MKTIRTAVFPVVALCLLPVREVSAQLPEALALQAIGKLPKPEDPVVLPTEAEVASHLKTMRESKLRSLQHDVDGWDDLEVMIWKSRDKNYLFEPGNKTKDTDGDGMADYEEMLVNRDATRKEPVYTRKQLIEQVREARRQAIRIEKARLAGAVQRLREIQPFFPRQIEENGVAKTVARLRMEDVQERLQAESRSAPAPLSSRLALAAEAAKQGVPLEERIGSGALAKFSGTYRGTPSVTVSDNHFSAEVSGTVWLWPTGLNTVTAPAATPALPPLWSTGGSGLNLTGAGTRIGLFEVGAVFDASYTQHEDLGSNLVTPATNRVLWQVDATSATDFHATAVAGVLAGRGSRDLSPWLRLNVRNSPANNIVAVPIGRAARGMSYEANVSAWDVTDSITELPAAFTSHNTRLSNHSYGLMAGWLIRGSGQLPRWYGNSAQTEDFRFGYYYPSATGVNSDNTPQARGMDEFAAASIFHLPVISAGNERLQEPAGQNGVAVPPTGILHEERNASGQWVQTSVYRTPDGDAGGYDSIRSPGTAKNILTVGAVSVTLGFNGAATTYTLASFSGRGPTDDGRLKPEIVAKGVNAITTDNGTSPQSTKMQFGGTAQAYQVISGTSFSAPTTTGALNLCHQRYAQLYPDRQPLHASSTRALTVHAARDFGAPGPDFSYGYGLLDAAGIVQLMQRDFDSQTDAFIFEAPVFSEAAGQPVDYIERLVRASGSEDLKVTVAWTDPVGDSPATTVPDAAVDVLKNDMGLTITAPNGSVWRPWVLDPDLVNESQAVRGQAATRGVNSRDNLEQVLIPAADVVAGGLYRIRIQREDVMTTSLQWISGVASGITPQPRPALRVGSLLKGVAPNTWIVEWPTIVGRDYQVQMSPDLQAWTNSGTMATASKETMAHTATVPAGNERYFFRVKETQ